MSDCIFCKIVSDELPAKKVYQDDAVVAFLDIQPVSLGHTLIIPREHSESIMAMTDEQLQAVTKSLRKIGQAVETATGADGFNIIVNKGKAAGQVIFHTHFHVIPRFEADNLQAWPKATITEDQMNKVALEITQNLQ